MRLRHAYTKSHIELHTEHTVSTFKACSFASARMNALRHALCVLMCRLDASAYLCTQTGYPTVQCIGRFNSKARLLSINITSFSSSAASTPFDPISSTAQKLDLDTHTAAYSSLMTAWDRNVVDQLNMYVNMSSEIAMCRI